MEVILWVGGILLLLWVLFQINKIGIIEEKIGVIFAKLDNLEKLDKLDFLKLPDDINELLPKPTKSQIPENLYILKIDGKTTNPILLTDIPKFLVDADNTYVWDNEKLIWKHILLFDEIASFCQIGAYDPSNWTTKNLDLDKFRNGDIIPEAKTDEEWTLAGDMGTPAWCHYDNDLDNGLKYGKLYNYHAVNDPRGLAPVGYHIPNDREWSELENLLGEEAGKKLKSKNGWKNSGNCTDLVGFKALPGGFRSHGGSFYGIRDTASFWSATELDSTDAWLRYLSANFGSVYRSTSDKPGGASVRCLRD
jgi:uncharacterized protein (TIGR02145 family)